jgi:hypothetical protein
MEPELSYRIIEQKVAHEVIDGEAVVIHFETGNYYSLTGLSSQVWQWFATRATRSQIIEALGPLTPAQIQSLDDFIESLVKEGILAKDPQVEPGPAPAKYEGPFEPPRFEKYHDMQNLLLSDPIHDVDATGWPNLDTGEP